MVVPHIGEGDNFFINPYDAHMLALLEQYIREQGYFMMMRCVGLSKEAIPLLSSWNVDGILFFGTFQDELAEIQQSLTVPAVFLDTYADDLNFVNVGVNDYQGGSLAAEYLLGKGHRKIALVCPNVKYPGSVIQHRYFGFRDACQRHGAVLEDDDLFEANTLYQSGLAAGQKIAASGKAYTAVWAMSDITAFGVMEGLRLCGVSVPEDVSVMGFDDLPECNYSNPKLTTISQNIAEKAQRAGDALFQLIRGGDAPHMTQLIAVELIERQSVRHRIEN